MNYTQFTLQKLTEFSIEHPEYTLGQLIYSALATYKEDTVFTKSDLFDISDRDMYTCLEKAIKREKEN